MMQDFETALGEHRDRVYTLAYYHLHSQAEAEDVTQEVLVRLWQNFRQIQPGHVLGWLLRVTRNACLDVFRKRKTRREVLELPRPDGPQEPTIDLAADFSPDPAELAESSDFQKKLEHALRQIDDPYRTILVLREIEDLKYEQIAEVLRLPLNTVKVYLHRGRRMLREQLHEVPQP